MSEALDTPIRYREVLWNLCVDLDATELGIVEVLKDPDDPADDVYLVSQATCDALWAHGHVGTLLGWLAESSGGRKPLPGWMLTPAWDRQPVGEMDVDVTYCVAAAHCLQDVIHRDRGFPVCAYHDIHWGEVEDLLG